MTTPKDLSHANLLSGQSILRDLNREMQKLAAAQRATTKRHTQWRDLAAPKSKSGDGLSGVMFENLMMGMLMQGLFGLPILSGLDLADETVQALGFVGTSLHHEATEEKPQPLEMSAMISAALLDAQKSRLDHASDAHEAQAAEMARLKKLMVMMLATMLMQDRNSKQAPDNEMVHDVLREPKIARFKQNRQSISCIKTLFQKQAAFVTPPALRCA